MYFYEKMYQKPGWGRSLWELWRRSFAVVKRVPGFDWDNKNLNAVKDKHTLSKNITLRQLSTTGSEEDLYRECECVCLYSPCRQSTRQTQRTKHITGYRPISQVLVIQVNYLELIVIWMLHQEGLRTSVQSLEYITMGIKLGVISDSCAILSYCNSVLPVTESTLSGMWF